MTFCGRFSDSPGVRIETCHRRRALLLRAGVGLLLLAAPAVGQDSGLSILAEEEGADSETISALLRESDENADGKLQREESPVGFLHRFDDVDLDRDGSIDSFEAWEYDGREEREEAAEIPPPRHVPVVQEQKSETIRSLVALVERFDANADQRLSSDELPDSLRTRLAEFDPNRDGFLDLDEARRIDTARAQAESQPRRRRTLAGLVTFMDTDGDGLLQKKEAPLRIQRVFEQFDRNRDGAIDPGEAKAVDDAAKDRGP